MRKSTIGCLSVHIEQLGSHWTDFHEIGIRVLFENLLRNFRFPYNRTRILGTLQEDLNTFFWSYPAHFFLEWGMFRTKVIEKIKKHILCSITIFRKSCLVWANVEKYFRAGQATDDNVAHARCMQNTTGYRHTLRIRNTFFFFFFFLLKKWLHERVASLRCTYVAPLVIFAADLKFCPPTHLISDGLTVCLSPHSFWCRCQN